MHARDRQLLAGLSKVNTRIGAAVIELLTLQPDDAAYAAGLRRLGVDLVHIGTTILDRAEELDGQALDPVELLRHPERQDEQPPP
ncbi:hypothetical protein [Amycolatopsis sp. lyj-346]|uniref:hypothetical protein n=1 Tax=Amycolatopsis sp. lyj-346 TaxID=2789289 RepID=UPI00397E69BD